MSETETNQSNQTAEASGAGKPLGSPAAAPTGALVFHLDQILQKRLLATFIDLVLVGVVAAVLIFIATMVLGQFFGSLFSFFVLAASAVIVLVKDMPFKFGELDCQSPGKKAMNIRVTDLQGNSITLKQSMQRNFILAMPYVLSALGSLLGAIPLGIGFIGTLFIVMPLMFIASIANVYEIYRIYSGERNRRWGDELAGTIVAWE
ncbi:MAG: RDD family protein [Candidatus Riflebacteria bacterium]|nr:RDD family protein [Candidatus Riflebacteria bacterium]